MAEEIALHHNRQDALVDVYNLYGLNHSSLNHYDKALTEFHRAQSICEEIENPIRLSMTLNNMAAVYSSLGENEKALELHLEAIQYHSSNFQAANNAAMALCRQEEYDQAISLFLQAKDQAEKAENVRSAVICEINLSESFRNLGDLKSAYQYLKLAEAAAEMLQDPFVLAHLHLQTAEVKLDDGKLEEAENSIGKAMSLAEKQQDRQLKLNCMRVQRKCYEQRGNITAAYQHLEDELSLRESLFNDQLTNKIAHITAMHDIEKKELEASQLLEKTSKLVSIGVMAAGITHEINQPLNAISVSANSVLYWHRQNPGILPELFIEELEQISKGVVRIDEIVRHMRSFWVSNVTPPVEPISLNETILNALTLIERQLYAHGIVIKTELSVSDHSILSDRVTLEQILINLVQNAMHALDESSAEDKVITISSGAHKDHIWFSVADNGLGIEKGKEKIIFDPFYSTKDPTNNMGLGLAIVKNLCHKMNSTITAANHNQGGAVFIVNFPKKKGRDANTAG